MGAKDYRRCVAEGLAYALSNGVCPVRKNGICPVGGGFAACLPGEIFLCHVRWGPVGRENGDGASDEGFRGGK